ncbi:myotubularin-related protein 12 isoform X2 [Narcine bancroftii]|uniref:myotubularin-related protein 12 isoform X2 n=1 Tax=Narcine bancroftii TaxID=1343680 RepID=UPI003831C1AE
MSDRTTCGSGNKVTRKTRRHVEFRVRRGKNSEAVFRVLRFSRGGCPRGVNGKPGFWLNLWLAEIKKKEGNNDLKPHLLPGELVICEANMVVKYSREDSLQRGFYGKLICTNFKISFLSAEQLLDDMEQPYRNKLMGENDISLLCVDQIFGVYDDKKKPLLPGAIKNKIPEKLLLYCKDFRVFQFGLRYSKEEDARRLIRGIVHHCLNPTSLKCLFAFSYVGTAGGLKVGPGAAEGEPPTLMFETKIDWKVELERTGGLLSNRIISLNENYSISTRLPQFFVIPSFVSDDDIKKYKGKGIPLWCWSHSNGSALMKMAAPPVTDDSTSQMDKIWSERLFHALGEMHPLNHMVRTEVLSTALPTLQEIQASYSRFKQLFLMDNAADFWESDIKWLTTIENANWLEVIRQCLKKALDIVECLEHKNTSVLLVEENGCDLCCVIASLVQVIIDPHFRTITGFQSLIQKEWLMGSHCFLDRCNHLRGNDKEAPVFLLFLECIWQLLQQYPPAFEFTETYLTILSDSMYIPIFSTFLFNSPYQKDNTQMLGEDRGILSRSLKLPTVWEWSVQFENSVQALFYNPLYIGKPKARNNKRTHRVKPQRQMSLPSSPSYHSRPSPKKGFLREETDNLIKTFLGKKISRWTFAAEDPPADYRLFYENWCTKPVDHHGLLLPLHNGPALKVWGQRYMRWIPEVQILGGGSAIALNKACEIVDEIKILQTKVSERMLKQQPNSPSNDIFAPFQQGSRLSSTFPFGTLRRQSIKPRVPVSTNHSMSFGSMENLPDDEEELGLL